MRSIARHITAPPARARTTAAAASIGQQRRFAAINPYVTSIADIAKGSYAPPVAANAATSTEPAVTVSLRGRLQRSRIKGNKLGFLVLRQGAADTIQIVVANEGCAATAAALETAKGLTPESVVEVSGSIVRAHKPITATSCSDYELVATSVRAITVAESPLPFTLTDANTKLDTRLDHRVIDLRTPATNAALRLSAKVCRYFREHLEHPERDYVEIHSPKMIGTPSEGGAAVFELGYFGQPAYLAQSPQLYKQMALMGDASRGVFEIGPVFRAEKSLTHRHLTEFTGLDAELLIQKDYTEVLTVLEGTMHSILHRLQTECADLIERSGAAKAPITILMAPEAMRALGVGEDCPSSASSGASSSSSSSPATPSTDLYGARVGAIDSAVPILRLPFSGAVQMLLDAKVIDSAVDDFNLQQEKTLGELIKARYGVDVYIIDLFPTTARPFYTMPDPADATRTLSYDMYLRGEEICSGAQRIHEPTLLLERAAACGVSTALIKDYVNAFRYGAYPHGGFGLGMERIVLFFLGLADVRQVSMFPRDPRRIFP